MASRSAICSGVHLARPAIASSEAEAIRRAPIVDPNIRARVESVVAGLVSEVKITGYQAGDYPLKIETKDRSGWDKDLSPLQMEALMRPTELTDAFVALIERRAEAPCSVAERPARIAALEKEVEGLRYIEEALLTAATAQGEVVTRSTDAPPWCVLGVKIVEKPQKRAAA